MTAATAAALDPFAPARDGRYEDDRVIVIRGHSGPLAVARLADGKVLVRHSLDLVDDDLAELLAVALAPHTDDATVFERAFAGIVLTGHADPLVAWERFYRASLQRTEGYAEIHRHALDLLPTTSVLDAGCSFGFLALQLHARGTRVLAWEPDHGTARLAATMAVRLGLPVDFVPSLAAVPDRSVDGVALLHVLEHVDAATGDHLLDEAMRIARRRVVVAVPYEPPNAPPTSLYGHVRHLDESTLVALGERTAWETTVHNHRGGWLVLDRRCHSSSAASMRQPKGDTR